MAPQVDVKALISHIVRGDGADKCRICMGDTSEGQVYLGDTVMMDEDRAVTLSELLEVITGVEVQLDGELPMGLCSPCNQAIRAAADFRAFCHLANKQWHRAVQLLNSLPDIKNTDQRRSIVAVIQESEMTVLEVDIFKPTTAVKQEVMSGYSDIDFLSEEEVEPKKAVKRQKSKRCGCPNCGTTFRFPKELYEHLLGSTDEIRACYICASIMSRKQLVDHIEQIHEKEIYSCKSCTALCKSELQYRKHLERFHNPKANFHCDCGRSFKTGPALYGHVTLHLNKNCPGCDKLFRNRKCYIVHVKQCCNLDMKREDANWKGNKVFFEVENKKDNKKMKVGIRGHADERCICDYCGKSFAAKKFVRAHIEIVHVKNTHRPCPYCGKSYAAAHMTEHIKRHEKTSTYKCNHCSLVLKTKLGFIQHIRLHTGEKPYKCAYCSAKFSASSRRSDHIRKIHKNPEDIVLKHCCDLCPAKFRLPFRLKRHMESVHNDKDNIKEFECPECHIKFSSYRGLLYHTRKHQSQSYNLNLKKDNDSKKCEV